jgi:protein TonB
MRGEKREDEMLLPKHEIISARSSGTSQRRIMIVGGVGLLHAAAIYALVTGMASTAVRQIDHVLQVDTVETSVPTPPTPMPPQPKMQQPTQTTQVTVPVPVIAIADNTPSTITVAPTRPNTPPVADSGATGLSNTHTTPPYPTEARAAAHQGTVVLQMTVSPQGDVVTANVTQSSGFPELDQAAMAWVIGHWKYKPAIQGGVPVTSQTQAAVQFDLKQASR